MIQSVFLQKGLDCFFATRKDDIKYHMTSNKINPFSYSRKEFGKGFIMLLYEKFCLIDFHYLSRSEEAALTVPVSSLALSETLSPTSKTTAISDSLAESL